MESIELVWFHPQDYASLGRRLAACLVDNIVVVAAFFAVPWLISKYLPTPATTQPAHKMVTAGLIVAAAIFWAIIAIPYHIGMRRTRRGTIGYRLAGIRLINMHNARPDTGVLFKRLLLSLVLPGIFAAFITFASASSPARPPAHSQPAVSTAQSITNLVMLAIVIIIIFGSYWSVTRSPRRQAQHDRFTGTWVVRAEARPAGVGVPIERAWIVGPVVLAYWDVDPAPSSTAAPHPCGGVIEEKTA